MSIEDLEVKITSDETSHLADVIIDNIEIDNEKVTTIKILATVAITLAKLHLACNHINKTPGRTQDQAEDVKRIYDLALKEYAKNGNIDIRVGFKEKY